MIRRLKNSRVIFHDTSLYETYMSLKNGTHEEQRLYKWITRAIQDLKEDAFCGVSIPKNRIPKKYQSIFEAKSVWKYDLPSAYRLIYTIENNEIEVFTIVLEWFDHKSYEKTFKY